MDNLGSDSFNYAPFASPELANASACSMIEWGRRWLCPVALQHSTRACLAEGFWSEGIRGT